MRYEPVIPPRSHCLAGLHEMTADNTYWQADGRRCKACRKISEDTRRRQPVELTCSQCGVTRTIRKQLLEPWRVARRQFPLDWCKTCVNKALPQNRRTPLVAPKLELVADDGEWRTPEEQEDKFEYWRSRYTPAEIHKLAASLHEVLDTGGSAARKYRLVHNRKRRAA